MCLPKTKLRPKFLTRRNSKSFLTLVPSVTNRDHSGGVVLTAEEANNDYPSRNDGDREDPPSGSCRHISIRILRTRHDFEKNFDQTSKLVDSNVEG